MTNETSLKIPLQNDHNVYILGAGFSCHAGLPLISDFLLRMRDSHDWLIKQGRDREADAVAQVLQFRLNAASAAYWVNLDLENIEELFSLASASPGNIMTQIRLAIAATLDYARRTRTTPNCKIHVRGSAGLFEPQAGKCPRWATKIDEGRVDGFGSYEFPTYSFWVAHLLGMFKDGLPQGQNTFISFNYDTVLEDAIINLGFRVGYGSALGGHPGVASPAEPNLAPIPVFKLHGSVNWARSDSNPNMVSVFANYDKLAELGLVPELVPPTWKKVFENQLESVWEEAITKLSTATRIVVIGFSMPPTDMHFKYLLAAGLQNNISLRQVLFANPDSTDELETRARKLLREAYFRSNRIAFNKENVHDFITGHHGNQNKTGLSQLGRAPEYQLQFDFYSF